MEITIRAARINAGYTQEQAARELGINRTTLIDWERGKRQIKAKWLLKLCDLYGVAESQIKKS